MMEPEDADLDPASEAILEAVEEQIASAETPYVAETAERLRREVSDLEEGEEKRLIAFCLLDEINRMVAEGRGFDANRYRTMLELLPVMAEGAG